MIVSHQHKYLFIENPLTGSTAISLELREFYSGTKILKKHSTYQEFLKVASAEEKEYFVFTGIRNPLDIFVSNYFKLKTNHRQMYTDPQRSKERFKGIKGKLDQHLFQLIQEKDIDFPTFFRKYYLIPYPYNNRISAYIKHFDYVIRFENLQNDFATVLKLIGLEPVRPLPHQNITAERKKEFWSYYTPDIIPRAKRIYGPYMKQWGYEFPVEWGDNSVPWWNQVEFKFFTIFRKIYWNLISPAV